MRRIPFLAAGPAVLLLLSAASAYAQDGGISPVTSSEANAVTALVRELGPFGALAWGAYLFGGAAKRLGDIVDQIATRGIPIRVEFAEEDRALLEAAVKRRNA